jgi:hypothetical protein
MGLHYQVTMTGQICSVTQSIPGRVIRPFSLSRGFMHIERKLTILLATPAETRDQLVALLEGLDWTGLDWI